MRSHLRERIQNHTSAERIAEVLVLALLGYYLLILFEKSSTFTLLYDLERVSRRLFYLVSFAVTFRLTLHAMRFPGRTRIAPLISLAAGAVAVVLSRTFNNRFFHIDDVEAHPRRIMLFIALFLIGCAGISYRKVLYTYLISVGSFYVITVIAAMSGAITNLVYFERGHVESSWGLAHPNTLSAYLFFGTAALWVCGGRIKRILAVAAALLACMITLRFAHSRTSFLCIVLLLFLMAADLIVQESILFRVTDALCILAFPVLAALSVYAVHAFRTGAAWAQRLNTMIGTRLYLASVFVDRYGFTWFGTSFDMRGAAGSTFYARDYAYIDSSYMYLLLRYGILALLIVTVLWTLGLYRAARAGNRRLLFTAVLVSMHALVEPQFMELVNNIFLLLPFTVLSDAARTAAGAADTLRPTDVRDPDNKKRMPLPALLAPALLLLLGFLMMPAWITHLHTIWEVLGWTGGRAAGVPVIAVLLPAGMIVVVTLVSSACALRHILSERNILSRPLVVTIAGAVCLIACHIAGSVLLMRAADAHTAIVEEDAQVLEAVLEEAEGAVYSSVLPYYYHARYRTMQQTMFTADDLARYDQTSVLTGADHDSLALMHRGFSYAEISGTHALYTNDAGVLRALDEAGIEYRPFFSRERVVQDTASYELHGGVYQVRFRLSADKDTLAETDAEQILCHLRMTSYYGEVVLFDVPLLADAFDRNGGYEDVTEITIGDERGVQFLVVPEEGADIRVEEIRFSRTE